MNQAAKIEYCRRAKRDAVRHARVQNHNFVAMRAAGLADAASLALYRRDGWMHDARRYARLIARESWLERPTWVPSHRRGSGVRIPPRRPKWGDMAWPLAPGKRTG
jgi:hypothetical protein